MELKELREKTRQDLNKLLAKMREKLRSLKFSVSAKQLKNIREVRETKRLIARIITVMKEQGKAKVQEELNNTSTSTLTSKK